MVFGAAAVFLLSLVHPLAGLFLAIDTLGIKYTSVIYLDALPTFAGLAALLAALKALELYQKQTGRRWAVWLVLSALALGITAASKYIYAVVGIAIIAAIILRGWKQKLPVLLGLAAWGVLSLVFFFVLDPVLWTRAPRGRTSRSTLISITQPAPTSPKLVIHSGSPSNGCCSPSRSSPTSQWPFSWAPPTILSWPI